MGPVETFTALNAFKSGKYAGSSGGQPIVRTEITASNGVIPVVGTVLPPR